MINKDLNQYSDFFSAYTELRMQENRNNRISMVNGYVMGNTFYQEGTNATGNLVAVAGAAYTSLNVINAGIGNYNSTMEVELFKLIGIKFKPDLVVVEDLFYATIVKTVI